MILYRSDSFQDRLNKLYPIRCDVISPEELAEVVQWDHVAAEYVGNHRRRENFLRSDVLMMDVDNSDFDEHKNEIELPPEKWTSPEDVRKAFPDVSFYVVYSRNHMKDKDREDHPLNWSARPRFHVYFDFDNFVEDETEYTEMKRRMQRLFPAFDRSARDSARFFNGVRDPKVEYFDGDTTLEEWLHTHPDAGVEKKPPARKKPAVSYPENLDRDELLDALYHVSAGCDNDTWVRIGMILKDEGFDVSVWDEWSQTCPDKYHSGECEKRWRSFHGSDKPVKPATIFQMARDAGWRPKPKRSKALGWNDPISDDRTPSDDPNIMAYDDVIRVDTASESDSSGEEVTGTDHSTTVKTMAASTSETVTAATIEEEVTPKTATAEKQTVKPPIGLVCASTVEYQEPRWLWKPYLQKGKLNLVQGESGAGKTALICALAAAVTTGLPIMNTPLQDSGSVLMLSVEDDPAILRGRFEADGGDVSKLFFMNDAYKLSFVSPEIEQAIQATNARLVVYDPMQAFLSSKVDLHRANETRPVLAALAAMAERNDCAVLIVAHTGKSTDKSAVYRSLGSADVPAAMRSILHVARDPDDPDECVALHVKSSNDKAGEALSYTIAERGRVDWRGFRDVTIGDIESGKPGRSASVRSECKEFILEALKNGEIPSKKLDEQLKMAGFKKDTYCRAKTELKADRKIRYIHSITDKENEWRVALTYGLHVINDQ